MEMNKRQLYKDWIGIFSENIKKPTVHSKLRKQRRSWLSRLMTTPYLPAITEWVLFKIMPRSTHVLGKRAAKLLGKSDLPKAYWQQLLILGNLPSDIINIEKGYFLDDLVLYEGVRVVGLGVFLSVCFICSGILASPICVEVVFGDLDEAFL